MRRPPRWANSTTMSPTAADVGAMSYTAPSNWLPVQVTTPTKRLQRLGGPADCKVGPPRRCSPTKEGCRGWWGVTGGCWWGHWCLREAPQTLAAFMKRHESRTPKGVLKNPALFREGRLPGTAANRRQPPTANRQPPTANCCQLPTFSRGGPIHPPPPPPFPLPIAAGQPPGPRRWTWTAALATWP